MVTGRHPKTEKSTKKQAWTCVPELIRHHARHATDESLPSKNHCAITSGIFMAALFMASWPTCV